EQPDVPVDRDRRVRLHGPSVFQQQTHHGYPPGPPATSSAACGRCSAPIPRRPANSSAWTRRTRTSCGSMLRRGSSARCGGVSRDGTSAIGIGTRNSWNTDLFATDLQTGRSTRLTRDPAYTDPMQTSPDDNWTAVMDGRVDHRMYLAAAMPGVPPLI